MRVAVTGSSGLVGSALLPHLSAQGHQVIRIVRAASTGGGSVIRWDPAVGTIELEGLADVDAVVHLAGDNIVGRWTAQKKARILGSRVRGTRLIATTLAAMTPPPKVLACASAIGYYGTRGEELLTETSAPGAGFLSEVCRAWEAAAEPARQRGIRVVHLRIGIVLSPAGGALGKMLLPFRLGLGGTIGGGHQWWSWVAIADVLGSITHALATDALTGPVNVAAPTPVTNRAFTKILGAELRRPTVCPVPAFVLRAALGEMADAVLLASARVVPRRLTETGYRFQHPELEGALGHLLAAT